MMMKRKQRGPLIRIPWMVLGLVVSLIPSCGASPDRLVLLIVVDTLRADHLGCYGYEAIETPNIDRLAAEGVLYENALTAVPVTLPSVATILTGAYPAQHGIRDNGPYQLDDAWLSLAERCQQSGFATGAFVSAAVLSRDHRLDQGFDIYDDDVSSPYVTRQPLMVPIQDQLQGIERRAEVTVDRALRWVREQRGQDLFLLVHLFDPHVPQDPPEPFLETYEGRLYDGEIAYVDREIGRLLRYVQRERSPGTTLTVLVADHGEGLGDHDEWFHGDLLFEETMRVPLIVHGGGMPEGVRVGEVVRTADIAPTVCAWMGLDALPWGVGGALPALHLSEAGNPDPREDGPGEVAYLETLRPRLSHNWCELRGLRTPRWKLIEGPGIELYDLEEDPGETTDLASARPATRDSLLSLMNRVALASVRRGTRYATSLPMTPERREQLRSLGYVTPDAARSAPTDSLAVWSFPPEERGAALGLPHPRERVAAAYRRVVADSFYSSALATMREGDYKTAAERFLLATRYNDRFTEAYLGLAEAAQRTGRPDVAVRYLREARKTLPDDPALVSALAEALTKMGERKAAIGVLEEAIAAGIADSTLMATRTAIQNHP